MDTNEFLRQVMHRAGSRDMREAEKQTRAVLAALTDGISHDEVVDMASQLPKEIKDFVTGREASAGPRQKIDRETLISRVQSQLGLDTPDQAEQVTRAVLSVLREAVSWGELEDVLGELSPDLRQMVIAT